MDSADLDALKETARSAGYALVVKRIREEIGRKLTDLEQSLDPEKTAYTRGYLKALRVALALPAILQAETETELARGKL
jgi:hypothetical protein